MRVFLSIKIFKILIEIFFSQMMKLKFYVKIQMEECNFKKKQGWILINQKLYECISFIWEKFMIGWIVKKVGLRLPVQKMMSNQLKNSTSLKSLQNKNYLCVFIIFLKWCVKILLVGHHFDIIFWFESNKVINHDYLWNFFSQKMKLKFYVKIQTVQCNL